MSVFLAGLCLEAGELDRTGEILAELRAAPRLACRLYISPKTAAVHVSNILHKLGVSSRTAVVDAVRADRS